MRSRTGRERPQEPHSILQYSAANNMTKVRPGEAVVFLAALAERVWLSRFFGKPSARLSVDNFCGDKIALLKSHYAGRNEHVDVKVVDPEKVKDVLRRLNVEGWPFACSPVKVVGARHAAGASGVVTISMLNGIPAERFAMDLASIIRNRDIGEHRLTQERSEQIMISLREAEGPLGEKKNLAGRRVDLREADSLRVRELYRRLQGLAIVGGKYSIKQSSRTADIITTADGRLWGH